MRENFDVLHLSQRKKESLVRTIQKGEVIMYTYFEIDFNTTNNFSFVFKPLALLITYSCNSGYHF